MKLKQSWVKYVKKHKKLKLFGAKNKIKYTYLYKALGFWYYKTNLNYMVFVIFQV